MKSREDLATGWIRKAESDLTDARRTLASPGPYDTACFHAQQAAEKCLKAFIAYQGSEIPRTHDLEELAQLCVEFDKTLVWSGLRLEQLTDYAVAARYDEEFWPDHAEAQSAVDRAEQVKDMVLKRLPLPNNQTGGA